ncbi:MAG: hypothetical protein VXW22_07215, partial [Pseudomonadota bacterium]|nr:hypothetical protein [Pseudomonadota bacterium]
LTALQGRLRVAAAEHAKAKQAISERVQVVDAKKGLAEANEKLKAAEGVVEEVAAFCAPLLEQGGLDYLVQTSIGTLGTALREQMKAETPEEMCTTVPPAKSTCQDIQPPPQTQ